MDLSPFPRPALVDHIAYDAFGSIAPGQTSTTGGFLFLHNGVYYDQATGLEYHSDPSTGIAGRWYNPSIQRWMSRDPSGLGPDSNPYRYCDNSPTNFVDPSGCVVPGTGTGPHGQLNLHSGTTILAWAIPPIPWGSPTQAPGPGWTWDGPQPPGGPRGQWSGPKGEKLHPDLNHGPPKGPHYGLTLPGENHYDFYPDGSIVPDKDNVPNRPSLNLPPPPPPNTTPIITADQAAAAAAGAGTGAVIYWIISEGSRIVFPPRNLVPIP